MNKLGDMDPEIKPEEPAQLQPNNRRKITTRTPGEEREIALPCCKYAYFSKTHKWARAQTHTHRAVAKRKETGASQEHRLGTPPHP